MLHARALDIASRLEKRATALGGDRLDTTILDAQAATLIRDMINDHDSRRSMIDQTVRGIRNGMVEVRPEELKVLASVEKQLQDAIKLARSTYDSKNLNVTLLTDLNAALVAAEFLLSHTLFTIEERKKV